MSGSRFEGLEPGELDTAAYTQGERGAHAGLVSRLISLVSDERASYLGLDSAALHIRSLLEKHPISNANAFLDEIVLELAACAPASESFSHSHHLLDPLVQALYDRGHDHLVLDITPLQKPPLMLADFLHGTPERKLTLTIIGDLYCVAQQAHNCAITCTGTISGVAASHAVTSEFIFGKSVSSAGPNAYRCTFDLQSWNALPPAFDYTSSGPKDRYWTFPTECVYHISDEFSRPALEYYRLKGFFIAGNMVHHLTPDGVWHEERGEEPVEMVRPT